MCAMMFLCFILSIFLAPLNADQGLGEFPGITHFFKYVETQTISNATLCDRQFHALVEALQEKQFWSLELFDSWGKWPAGVFVGNLYELGHYDQCVKLRRDAGPDTGIIQGRYCFLTVPLENMLPNPGLRIMPGTTGDLWAVHLGICIPGVCSAERFIQLLHHIIPNLPTINLKCNKIIPKIGTTQILSISFFATILGLALTSTLYEAFVISRGQIPHRNLILFSLYYNGKKMFSTRQCNNVASVKSSTIACINGIRVISMVWVVFSHNYVRIGMQPLINSHTIVQWLNSYHSVLVIASTVSVDSFFLLSGLLTCWSILNALDKHGRLNLPIMYLHRYLRLTPALAATVLFSATLMEYAGSGPFWDSAMTLTSDTCREYWWSALLYVQNYVNPRDICLGHSWYLSVDMQLYLLSPMIIYPLWRWGRRILIPIVSLIVGSMIVVFVMFHVHKLRLSFLAVDQERIRHVHTYYPTHTRAGAWLVGVIYGYVLQRTKKNYVILPRWTIILGWILSACGMLSILIADYPIQQPDYDILPQTVDATYEALSRVGWATAVGWIIFACVNGYGGIINEILSATIWQPLGRLSYSIYLLHLPIQLMMAGAARLPYYFTDLLAVYQFWGDIGFTLTLALLWVLLFESPIIGLERMLFSFTKRMKKSKSIAEPTINESVLNTQETIPKKLSLAIQIGRL